jgi:hypothetical protein
MGVAVGTRGRCLAGRGGIGMLKHALHLPKGVGDVSPKGGG